MLLVKTEMRLESSEYECMQYLDCTEFTYGSDVVLECVILPCSMDDAVDHSRADKHETMRTKRNNLKDLFEVVPYSIIRV